MIDSILQNAVNIPVGGVTSSFLTPYGNIAGQFFSDYEFYDYEIEGDTVYWHKNYRRDGNWVKPSQGSQKGTMTPSAASKTTSVRATLAKPQSNMPAKPTGGGTTKAITPPAISKQLPTNMPSKGAPTNMPAKPTGGGGGGKAITSNMPSKESPTNMPAKPDDGGGEKVATFNRIKKTTGQISTGKQMSNSSAVRTKGGSGFSIQKEP